MARTITWTDSAIRDVEQIAAYISRDSPQYAASFVSRTLQAIDGAQLFPEAATRVGEYDRDDLREIYVGNYRLIYQFSPDEVIVLAMVHAARNLKMVWQPPNT